MDLISPIAYLTLSSESFDLLKLNRFNFFIFGTSIWKSAHFWRQSKTGALLIKGCKNRKLSVSHLLILTVFPDFIRSCQKFMRVTKITSSRFYLVFRHLVKLMSINAIKKIWQNSSKASSFQDQSWSNLTLAISKINSI